MHEFSTGPGLCGSECLWEPLEVSWLAAAIGGGARGVRKVDTEIQTLLEEGPPIPARLQILRTPACTSGLA